MGSVNSREDHIKDQTLKQFNENYEFVRDVLDIRFGEITVYQRKQCEEKEYIMCLSQICQDDLQFQILGDELKHRCKFQNDYLLAHLGYSLQTGDKFCGNGHQIVHYTEWHYHNLQLELDKRVKHKEYFSEPEIWYTLDCLVQVGYYLEQKQIYHGDLRPINIFLSQNGEVKIADHGLLNQYKNGYLKSLNGLEKCYLSPELLAALKKKEFEPKVDVFKSDVFTLGLTLLQACTLKDPIIIYDFYEKELKYPMLTSFFESVEEKYSKYLLEFIKRMLVSNQSTRPNFRDLFNMITPQKSQGTALKVKDEDLKFSSITDLNNRDSRKVSNQKFDSKYNEKTSNFKSNIENIQDFEETVKPQQKDKFVPKTVEDRVEAALNRTKSTITRHKN